MSNRRSILLLLLVSLLAVATYLQFSDVGKDHDPPRSVKALWNLGHILYFLLLIALLYSARLLDRFSLSRQWLLYIGLTLVLGLAIEILQMNTSRSSDWMDLMRDLTGCLLVLAFAPRLSSSLVDWLKNGMRVGVLLLLLWQLTPLQVAVIDEALARRQFPVLSDFSTPFELDRWSGNVGTDLLTLEGGRLLRVTFGTQRYSSLTLDYPATDWRGYGFVHLRIYLPQPPALGLSLRIHDARHERGAAPFRHADRYHQRIWLNPGWNEVRLSLAKVEAAPSGRAMDLSRISNLMLYTSRLEMPRTLFLDKVYLEPPLDRVFSDEQ